MSERIRISRHPAMGRFSRAVLTARARSLGYVLTGNWSKPYGHYVLPVRRLRDGETGSLKVRWTEQDGWSHEFTPSAVAA